MIGLYALPYAPIEQTISDILIIDMGSLIVAGVTLVSSNILYVIAPKRHTSYYSFAIYILLTGTAASLIMSSGETSSPFIALWIAVALFAGVFGPIAYAFIFTVTTIYVLYALSQNAPYDAYIIAGLAGTIPLIASYIIWHKKSDKDNKRDRAYTDLASELSHEANRSEVVLSAINDGVIAVDKQGVIQLINPAAQNVLGWGQRDALGLSYKSVIKLYDRTNKPISELNDPVEQVLSSNQQVHSEDFSINTESGKRIYLSLMVSPIGQPSTGAILVFRDMTKEKSEEREQAEFISTASHEMRTPVASIEGYLGLVLNPATAQIDDKAREYVEKAQDSAKHLGRLFQDLLDVSKAEDGRISNNPKVVDVVEFVGDVVEGLRHSAEEKQLRFVYKPQPQSDQSRTVTPVFYAKVDADHLREVVANLTENAIKYTNQGDVIINVTGSDRLVTFSVQDSGVGIPPEDIPHLFQKFYRVDNTETREIGGTGLGLYLCRRLAEIMNGHIRVESEFRRGSTFYLDIPRLSHEDAMRLMEEATLAVENTVAVDPSPQPVPDFTVEPSSPPPPPSPGFQTMQPVMPPQRTAPQSPAPQPVPQPASSPTIPPRPSLTIPDRPNSRPNQS